MASASWLGDVDLFAFFKRVKTNGTFDDSHIRSLFDLPDGANVSTITSNLNANSQLGGILGGGNWWNTIITRFPDATVRKKFLEDITGNPTLAAELKARPELVRAWEVAHRAELPSAIRTSPVDLEKISTHLVSTGKTADDLAVELAGNLKTASGTERSWLDIIPNEGGDIVGYKGNYVQRESGEVIYRTISESDYDELLATGRMPSTTETSTSPTQAFSEDYDGILVKYYVNTGTIDQFRAIGRTDGSNLVAEQFGNMPQATSGWTYDFVRFKKEGTQVNIQLGRGPGVQIFNDNLIAFERIVP